MKKRIFIFTIAFCAFYLFSISMGRLPDIVHGNLYIIEESHGVKFWIRFIVDIFLFYALALGTYLLLGHYYPRNRIFSLVTSISLLCLFFLSLGFYMTWLIEDSPQRLRNYFRLVSLTVAMHLTFAAVFYFIRYSRYKEMQHLELQLQNRQTELSFLRSQVNPHFLFNSLNNIYALVHENNSHALPAISGLAEVLRYMLYDAGEIVPLHKEAAYMEKYIALQQLRFEMPSPIAADVLIDGTESMLPPLTIIPFVENAFKHGAIQEDMVWLKITLRSDSERLVFECHNLMADVKTDSVGGIGINNARKRLALLYPDGRHQLEISKNEGWFNVRLVLEYGE